MQKKKCIDAYLHSLKVVQSFHLIVGYSVRNLTAGAVQSDVCQSPSWLSSHGGPAKNRAGCLQRLMEPPNGCLSWRYLRCRAGVHCQFALIRGMHHPKSPPPCFCLSELLWTRHEILRDWKGKSGTLRKVPYLWLFLVNLGCFCF